ncbi:hypothetical protein pipiens_000643, partial [Culex pipiens pipiens]
MDYVAHQQKLWTMSTPTICESNYWDTPVMACESAHPELSGQTANSNLRSRPENLDTEVILRNHSPSTSYTCSPPETRSRSQTLEADTALRSRMPPKIDPIRPSKPTSASDVLDTEVVMRDQLQPATDANPTDLPVSAISSKVTETSVKCVPLEPAQGNPNESGTGRVLPDDGTHMTGAPTPDSVLNHEASLIATDNGIEPQVETDERWELAMPTVTTLLNTDRCSEDSGSRPEAEMMSTVLPSFPEPNLFNSKRSLTDGDARTKEREPLPAVNLRNEKVNSLRVEHGSSLTTIQRDAVTLQTRAELNPPLPTAAKAPDKRSLAIACPNPPLNDTHGTRKKHAVNKPANPSSRKTDRVSPKFPDPLHPVLCRGAPHEQRPTSSTSGDLRDTGAPEPNRVNVTHQHHEVKPPQKRKSETEQLTKKCVRSERKGGSKHALKRLQHRAAPKKSTPTSEALNHRPLLNEPLGLPQKRRTIAAVFWTCLKLNRTNGSLCCSKLTSNLKAIIVESRTKPKTPRSRSLWTTSSTTAAALVSMLPILLAFCNNIHAKYYENDFVGRETSFPKNGRGPCEQIVAPQSVKVNRRVVSSQKVRLLRLLEGWQRSKIPSNPPYSYSTVPMSRSCNRRYDDDSNYTRRYHPRKPIVQDVGGRSLMNDSEPAHRKCSVGERTLEIKKRPTARHDDHTKLHRDHRHWIKQACAVCTELPQCDLPDNGSTRITPSTCQCDYSRLPGTTEGSPEAAGNAQTMPSRWRPPTKNFDPLLLPVATHLINNSTLRFDIINANLISKNVESMLQRGDCSLTCYKTHQETPCEAPPKTDSPLIQEDRNLPQRTYLYTTVDTVDPAMLEQLGHSDPLKNLLYNPHLRRLLQEIDSAPDAMKAVRVAMMEPLFVEFADQCLRVVEPANASETHDQTLLNS